MFWELLKDAHQAGSFMDCNFTLADVDPSYTTLPVTKKQKKSLKRKLKPGVKARAATYRIMVKLSRD